MSRKMANSAVLTPFSQTISRKITKTFDKNGLYFKLQISFKFIRLKKTSNYSRADVLSLGLTFRGISLKGAKKGSEFRIEMVEKSEEDIREYLRLRFLR